MKLEKLEAAFIESLRGQYTLSQSKQLFQIMALEHLGLNRAELRLSNSRVLTDEEQKTFFALIVELQSGKPFQQILGKTEFYHLEFIINRHVLIPRPETEELVELTISQLKQDPRKDLTVLDIGTGSGIIPIVLKTHLINTEVHALDISKEALQIAQANAKKHQCLIKFHELDVLKEPLPQNFDVLISNPPYIGMDEHLQIDDSVKKFEPIMALFSPTQDPLLFYKRIANLSETHLNDGGYLFLEINQKLGTETLALYQSILSEVNLIKDLSGNDRFIIGRK